MSNGDDCQPDQEYSTQEEQEYQPDYSKFNEDSVPPAEREIKHTHKGRPDLDYDDTPVGPAPGVEYIHEDQHHGHQHQHHHRQNEEEEQ